MSQVTGTIAPTTDGAGFRADFLVGGRIYTYTAVSTGAVPVFQCTSATLNYASTSQLTGTPTFSGSVGQYALGLTLLSTPTITGELNQQISSVNEVDGSGRWSDAAP